MTIARILLGLLMIFVSAPLAFSAMGWFVERFVGADRFWAAFWMPPVLLSGLATLACLAIGAALLLLAGSE